MEIQTIEQAFDLLKTIPEVEFEYVKAQLISADPMCFDDWIIKIAKDKRPIYINKHNQDKFNDASKFLESKGFFKV